MEGFYLFVQLNTLFMLMCSIVRYFFWHQQVIYAFEFCRLICRLIKRHGTFRDDHPLTQWCDIKCCIHMLALISVLRNDLMTKQQSFYFGGRLKTLIWTQHS